jgi:hypothetical protein
MSIASIQMTYEHLGRLDIEDDCETSAFYRQLAQDILADLNVSFRWRQMIADRLNEANILLGMMFVGHDDDSY